MPTAPFSSQFVTDLAGETSWRFEGNLGPVFTPRFFCCDDPNSGVNPDGKEPVAVIELSPNPAFVGETVNYAGTLSYDPDGSVTGYAWTFESHTPSSGTASSGTLNYGTAGTYTIQLIVTDGTGIKSLPARDELVVAYPTFDAYTATETGVFYGTASGGTTTWTSKNAATGDNDVAIDPATQTWAEASKVVWVARDGAVLVSNDGGATYGTQTPSSVTNQWSDSPAPQAGSLNYVALLFADDKLFVGATWQNGSSAWRSWVFYTTDYPDMRASTAGSVTWTELTTNWEA